MSGCILVTGGAGFIGYHTVQRLLKSENRIIVADNFSTGAPSNLFEKVQFVYCDISSMTCTKIFDKFDIQYVVHLAAQISVADSIRSPYNDLTQNIVNSLTLFELCKKNNVKK